MNLPVPPHISRWLLRHVDIVEDVSIPTIGSRMHNGRYEIRAGKLYLAADAAHQRTLILHEIGHILRGDCIRTYGKDEDRGIWNMAQDACINATLPRAHVKKMDGVLYDKVAAQVNKQFPDRLPTTYLPETKPIYEGLMDLRKNGGSCDCAACGQQGADHEPSRADRAAHAMAVIEGRDIAKELGLPPGSIAMKSQGKLDIVPHRESALEAVLKVLRGKQTGIRRPARTHLREGRVDGIRGNHRLPRLKCVVALDDSGSCVGLHDRMAAIARYLTLTYDVILVQFDSEARIVRSLEKPTGGGTAFRPVWKIANEQRADAVLILTDGEAGDIKPLPSCPIIWALVQDCDVPVRAQDRKVRVLNEDQ